MKNITFSIITASLLATSAVASDSVTKAEFYELSDMVEQIETKTLTDKINLSPEIDLRVDSFSYEMNGIDGNRDDFKVSSW